jgi:alpha-ketoglutarate-dependent 2,4-dichlorophenoxyacetate dioxygenase
MTLSTTKLHPIIGGEVGPIDLRKVGESDLESIRAAMDEYAVLVFRDQELANDDQVEFARRLDGTLHTKTGVSALKTAKRRFDNEAVSDISNVNAEGQLLDAEDRKRLQGLANRLWHTDASFTDPPGRYSMLSARVVPPVAADTQFADMRAAYDALPEAQKAALEGLIVHHSIAYWRATLGFDFTEEEKKSLPGAYHPLVRSSAETGRKSLYLASHASMIVGWPVPEGRMLLRELIEHATRPEFVFSHAWRVGDLVIWDNRTTMHRATAFDDKSYVRDMRRVTTLDVDRAAPHRVA